MGTPQRRAVLAGGAGLFLGAAAKPSKTKTPRVVSLNPCLDAILVHVAPRHQILALSHYARDPQASGIVEIARTFPFTYETAEEVVALRPDLVLTSQHSSLATHQALERLGVQVELFTVPNTVQESYADVRRVAALVGHEDKGEALIAKIETALVQAEPGKVAPIKALIFQPNGFAAGSGTLVNEVMTRAGFTNVAARYGLKRWGNVSLEQLLNDPPEILLSGRTSQSHGTWAERLLVHPALSAISGQMKQADFPERLLYCGGPTLIQTAQALSRARQQWLGARA